MPNTCASHDKILRPKLSQRDIAGILQIDTKTLYNWRKHKPNLYRIVMLGFKFEEMLELSREHYENLLEIQSQITNASLPTHDKSS